MSPAARLDPCHRAASAALLGATLALAGCGEASTLPVDGDAAITRAVAAALTGCGASLSAAGDIDEAALLRAGWQPHSRQLSQVVTTGASTGMQDRAVPPATPAELPSPRDYESSVWELAGVNARLELSRNGGPLSQRTMGECRLPLRGDDGTSAEVRAVLTARLGRPTATGTRSPGGDWLTPRWFEPDIRVAYWRRPRHDVYWVSSLADHAALEVVAMPDRAALDQWSTSRPDAKFSIEEVAS